MKYLFSDLEWRFLFIFSCRKLTYKRAFDYVYYKGYFIFGIKILQVRIE